MVIRKIIVEHNQQRVAKIFKLYSRSTAQTTKEENFMTKRREFNREKMRIILQRVLSL